MEKERLKMKERKKSVVQRWSRNCMGKNPCPQHLRKSTGH